jgi:hypothetical protein
VRHASRKVRLLAGHKNQRRRSDSGCVARPPLAALERGAPNRAKMRPEPGFRRSCKLVLVVPAPHPERLVIQFDGGNVIPERQTGPKLHAALTRSPWGCNSVQVASRTWVPRLAPVARGFTDRAFSAYPGQGAQSIPFGRCGRRGTGLWDRKDSPFSNRTMVRRKWRSK